MMDNVFLENRFVAKGAIGEASGPNIGSMSMVLSFIRISTTECPYQISFAFGEGARKALLSKGTTGMFFAGILPLAWQNCFQSSFGTVWKLISTTVSTRF